MCSIRVSRKRFLSKVPKRVSSKMSHKSVKKECQAKSVKKERLAKSAKKKSVKQECPANKVSAFGFVGSIRFLL